VLKIANDVAPPVRFVSASDRTGSLAPSWRMVVCHVEFEF
jgi:hypothetical protein